MATSPDLKESVIVQILKYWPVKYLIVALLALLVWSGFYHFYRCHEGLNSRFLWGAAECIECKQITIDSITKHDTITVYDTVRVPVYVKSSTGSSKAKLSPYQQIDSSGSGIQNNAPNYGNQAGRDLNLNQYGPKPREVTDSLLSAIEIKVSFNKNIPITVFRRSADNESNEYATKIVLALKKAGFTNSFVNGIVSDPILGGDPEENAKLQRKIKMEWDGGQFNITIPSQ